MDHVKDVAERWARGAQHIAGGPGAAGSGRHVFRRGPRGGKGMSCYPLAEHAQAVQVAQVTQTTQVKHDSTSAVRKDRHRTVFGNR
jgi:hypothetical protein